MDTSRIDHFHPRVSVQRRMVDEDMAELMDAVWGFGLQTVDCCQGGPESPFYWAWVHFAQLSEGVRFLEGTGYLGNWKYADQVHLYLAHPLLPQAGPSAMVLIDPALLPEVTKNWVAGTVHPSAEKEEQNSMEDN